MSRLYEARTMWSASASMRCSLLTDSPVFSRTRVRAMGSPALTPKRMSSTSGMGDGSPVSHTTYRTLSRQSMGSMARSAAFCPNMAA